MSHKKTHNNGNDSGNDMNSSGYSITSASFVHASMKEALASTQHGNNLESQKGNLIKEDNSKREVKAEPPKQYEKMLQKLESDIRGHIRVRPNHCFFKYLIIFSLQLEHEMKIHLDYLEGRVEELENLQTKYEQDKKQNDKKIQVQEDKLKLLREETQSQITKMTKDKLEL